MGGWPRRIHMLVTEAKVSRAATALAMICSASMIDERSSKDLPCQGCKSTAMSLSTACSSQAHKSRRLAIA